jgi:hypothetical protein
LADTPGTQWFDSSSAQPVWTAVLDDGGERVVTLRTPFSLPLVPDELAVGTRNVVWVLRHDAQGDISWALALGHAGMGDVNWEAYWRGSDDAPENLDAARAILPYAVVRHVLRTHGARTQWSPVAAAGRALGSTRYNRVEGFSMEVPVWVELQPGLRIDGWVRPSTTTYPTGGGASVFLDRWPDRWGIQAYRRLQDANLWEPAHRKGNSLSALFIGRDDGHYYTAQGLSLWTERIHGLRTWRVEIFREEDRFAEPRTSYHVLSSAEDTVSLGPTLLADDGEYTGIRGVFEQQWGLAPEDGVVVTRLWWGAATGSGEYVNVGGMVEGLKTWGGWAAGLRAGAGRAFGDAPLQRQYFLGGTTNVRGFRPASAEGPAVLLGRAEVGYGVPALRVIAFGDVGWAGEPSALRGLAAAGIGFSFGEGLFRLDLAKAVHGGSGFKVYLSGNGFL